MYDLIQITAKIELFSGKDMRTTPFVNGYRPLFYFLGANTHVSGQIKLIDNKEFSPGMTGLVEVTFIKGIISGEYFKKGGDFSFSEGRTPLGKGIIMEVIMPE